MYELVDILTLAAMLTLVAAAVSVEWSISRTANFAIADVALFSVAAGEAVLGAGWPGWLLALVLNAAARLFVVFWILLPLYRRNVAESRRIAASLGISLLTVAGNGLLFGTTPVSRGVLRTDETLSLGDMTLSIAHLEPTILALGVFSAFVVWLRWTGQGQAIALFTANAHLAAWSGLRANGVRVAAVLWSSMLAFAGVRVLAASQDIGAHDGGTLMAFALGIAFIARARVTAVVIAAVVSATIACLAGIQFHVDISKAAGLLFAALVAVALDERDPFRSEEHLDA